MESRRDEVSNYRYYNISLRKNVKYVFYYSLSLSVPSAHLLTVNDKSYVRRSTYRLIALSRPEEIPPKKEVSSGKTLSLQNRILIKKA